MTVQKRTSVLFLTVAVAAGVSAAVAAQQAVARNPQAAPLTAALPIDADITTGQLDNGLKYFIRENSEPQNRAELRLVVNVGSLVEEEDQQGLAHFLEHMAFNGTRNFPKQSLVQYLESTGMRFGPSINAYTSFDETVYMLQIPIDDQDTIDKAFMVLSDWAQAISLDGEEIDKERGVVIEEWRLGRGAGARMQDQQFPILLKGSRYAERLPIGTLDVLENFEHDRVREFYRTWYRPDLMSVIVVGGLETAAVEGLVRTHFGSIPAPTTPTPETTFDVPAQPGTLYAIATDPEATSASVAVYSKMALRDHSTVGAYRQQIVESLFGNMLSQRYAEIALEPDAPFLGAGAARGLFVKSAEASMLQAGVREDEIDRGLEALFVEAERVARFGFTATELERQKTNILRGLERALANVDSRPSSQLAAEYVRHVTQDEGIPGLPFEYGLYERFLPEITLDEVNSLASEWTPDGNRVVMVSAPDKPGLDIPDEARLAEMLETASEMELEPYEDSAATGALMANMPEPGSITSTSTIEEFGVTEWTLSNGITVVLKPTDFKEDEIVFSAFSPGGTSLAETADVVPAQTAAQLVGAGGLGEFSAVDLGKAMAGKVASAGVSFGSSYETIGGGGSPKDLDTLFQLIHMRFTAPRADPQIFEVLKSQLAAVLPNQEASPGFAFQRELNSARTQDNPRARLMTADRLDELDLDKSMAFYQDRMADAGDYTFVFVGSFELDAMRPLVEQYLASLPTTGREETWRDPGVEAPDAVVEREVRKGLEPQSQTAIVFTGPFEYGPEQRVTLGAMASILQTRLREQLREEMGGTYSVSASASPDRVPREEYSLSISFGSAPDRVESLVASVFAEIETLKADGPTEQQVADARQALLRSYETGMRTNNFIAAQLVFKYQSGEPVTGLLNAPQLYEQLSAEAIKAAATQYLNMSRYVKVSLFPEG